MHKRINDKNLFKGFRLYFEGEESSKQNTDNFFLSNPPNANEDIIEVWGFVCSLNIGEFRPQDLNVDSMIKFLQSYRVEMSKKS
jgi:hypothetical protein